MKKMIKNLMLVAVAAMAFVACSQEGNEVNILTKKTVFEFTAGFEDETRSSFGEKNEEGVYPSFWNGNESITVIFSDAEGVIGVANSRIDSLGEGVESSATASFTIEYEGELPENYSITAYSGNWYYDEYTKEVYYNLSNAQRCTDISVDSYSHLCASNSIEVVSGELASKNFTFNTATSFGKVTMPQFASNASAIEEVVVTINGTTTFEITPSELATPTVWFACDAIESVTSLVVEAKVDGVTYIKSSENIAEGALSFNTGRVRPIKVSEMTEKPADYEVVLTKITKINGNTISFTGETSNDRFTIEFNPSLETIVAGTYTGVDASYGSGFSSDSALEYNYNGSTFNISAAYNESYDFYMNGSPIVITDLGDNNFRLTTTTSTYVPADSATKTVKITFEGKLEAEAPDTIMDSATYYYDYNNLGGYNYWGYIVFEDETLGTLVLNVSLPSGLYLDVKKYTSGYGLDIEYCRYAVAGGTFGNLDSNYSNNMVVTIVDGKYNITLDFKSANGDILNATYVGDIVDFDYPDLRTQLATPSNLNYTIEGNIVTITWGAVENAGSYLVYTDSADVTTKETYATFELEGYGYYNFYVKALASEADSDTYRDSNEANIGVNYEDPREVLELSNVSATASGNTVTISWNAVADAGSYSVTFNGNTQDTTNTEVIFTGLEYNTEYNYSVVANPKNEETHRASYPYSGYVTTERDPNAGFDYDITFTSCSVGSNNMYTFTDGSYTLNLKLNSALEVGIFENTNDNYWVGNDTTIVVPGVSFPGYIYNGTLDVSLNDDIYTVVLTSYNCWVNGVSSTLKLTYIGSIGEDSSSGPDTTGYSLLATGSHSWSGSTLTISDTYYQLQAKLYNGGAGSVVVAGEYTFGGIMSIEGTISGSNLLDGSKATIYDNGDGTYTVLLDVVYLGWGGTSTTKLYYTFS